MERHDAECNSDLGHVKGKGSGMSFHNFLTDPSLHGARKDDGGHLKGRKQSVRSIKARGYIWGEEGTRIYRCVCLYSATNEDAHPGKEQAGFSSPEPGSPNKRMPLKRGCGQYEALVAAEKFVVLNLLWISRPTPLITPVVRVWSKPNGFPIASTCMCRHSSV